MYLIWDKNKSELKKKLEKVYSFMCLNTELNKQNKNHKNIMKHVVVDKKCIHELSKYLGSKLHSTNQN